MVDDVTYIAHRRSTPKCPFMHGKDVGNVALPLEMSETSSAADYMSITIEETNCSNQDTASASLYSGYCETNSSRCAVPAARECRMDDNVKIDILCAFIACLNICAAFLVLFL
jgi:hypothetical protein